MAQSVDSRRVAWRFVLGLVLLATAWRTLYLAGEPTDDRLASRIQIGQPERPPAEWNDRANSPSPALRQSAQTSPDGRSAAIALPSQAEIDAELANLYAHCPTAAIVGLDAVFAASPNAGELLPPYQQTAARQPLAAEFASGLPATHAPPAPPRSAAAPVAPSAVPRHEPVTHIRYPQPLRVAATPQPAPSAAVPRLAQGPAPAGAAPIDADQWLVDPNEWYTPAERRQLEAGFPAGGSAGPSARAEAAPSDTPGWQLLTPDEQPNEPANLSRDERAPNPGEPLEPLEPLESLESLESLDSPESPPAVDPPSDAAEGMAPDAPQSTEPPSGTAPAPELDAAGSPPAAGDSHSPPRPAFSAPPQLPVGPAIEQAPPEGRSIGPPADEHESSTGESALFPPPRERLPQSDEYPPFSEGEPLRETGAGQASSTESNAAEVTEDIAEAADIAESPVMSIPGAPFRVPENDFAPTLELPPTQPATDDVDDPRQPPHSLFAPPGEAPRGTPAKPIGPPAAGSEMFSAPPSVVPPSTHVPHGAPGAGSAGTGEGAGSAATEPGSKGVDPHLELFARNAYPSARECAQCHEEIYEQWSVSAHAYAAVSPMFHKFEQKLNDLSQGTVGYFCMRCHAPVATSLYASRAEPLWNLPEVAREGVTCIACHRVQYVYGKSNGERRIEEGNIFAPVMGGVGGDGVAEAIHRKDHFKVKTSPDEQGPGQNIHLSGIYFDSLTRSEACASCHQVAVHPGIKLEVVYEQYRASPACKKGIQCQDCHMGRVPGLPLGYDTGPVAKIVDKTVNEHRRKSNHVFYGPNYSIAHPGVFPFHLKANRWTMDEWLSFDWRAGWGTDEFEDRVADGEVAADFPPVWAEADDRYDAREIIEDNLKKLDYKRDIRRQVMENGSHVDGPFFDTPPRTGQDLRFHFFMTNKNEGHNLLTASLGAQPQLWANVVLIGPDGQRLWETGYTDSHGDLANIHSRDVRQGRLPFDWQLFNLQTMFLITGAKGTDREFFVPVNLDIDQLAFIRPGTQPITTINHPPFIRMESQSLAPLGTRKVPYRIPGELLRQPGMYRLSFRMRSRAEPIYFMDFCGATPEMRRAMNEWMIDVHPFSVEFYVP